MKTKWWVTIIIGIFIICAGISVWLKFGMREGHSVYIYENGNVKYFANLDAVSYDEIKIETEAGYNVVVIDHGKVYVSEADCQDKICVNTGVISGSGMPIVCLPHKVVIEITGGSNDWNDAVSQ